MTTEEYFTQVKNLTFHDLTADNILPKSSNLLLGLGLKFIPTPKGTTPDDLDITLSRFEQDIGLKTFFSGATKDDSYDPLSKALRINLIWRAPLPPQEINTPSAELSETPSNPHTLETTYQRLNREYSKRSKRTPTSP